jgi:hypothetical protein
LESYAAVAGRLKTRDQQIAGVLGQLPEAVMAAESGEQIAALCRAYVDLAQMQISTEKSMSTILNRLREILLDERNLYGDNNTYLMECYRLLAPLVKVADAQTSAELGKLREAIEAKRGARQVAALIRAYAELAGRLEVDDEWADTTLNRLMTAVKGNTNPFDLEALSQAYAAVAALMKRGDTQVGIILENLREAISVNETESMLSLLTEGYGAVAGNLKQGDAQVRMELSKLREAMGQVKNSYQFAALSQCYADIVPRAKSAMAPKPDIAMLHARIRRLSAADQFLSAARAELAAAKAGTQPLPWDQLGLIVTDLLLSPLSAGEPTRYLVDEYEKLLQSTSGAPKPETPWSSDLWSFVVWAQVNLPGFDHYHVRLDFLPSYTAN